MLSAMTPVAQSAKLLTRSNRPAAESPREIGTDFPFWYPKVGVGKTRKACANLIFHSGVWIDSILKRHCRHTRARERDERISKISLHS